MNEKKFNIFLASAVVVLLIGLYYVIFIHKDEQNSLKDEEGSCNIDGCEEEKVYIKENEKIKTFEDNYLILPNININNNETITEINNKIEERFKYYKDKYDKDNTKYLSTYKYKVDEDKNVLSLLIQFCGDDENQIYTCEFVIYNIDINHNKLLTNTELLKLYGVELNNKDMDKSLIYLNEEEKLIQIIETEDNFIERVIN